MLPDTVDGNHSMPAFCSMDQAPKYISKHRQSVNTPSVFCPYYYSDFFTCPSLLETVTRVPGGNIGDISAQGLSYHMMNVICLLHIIC